MKALFYVIFTSFVLASAASQSWKTVNELGSDHVLQLLLQFNVSLVKPSTPEPQSPFTPPPEVFVNSEDAGSNMQASVGWTSGQVWKAWQYLHNKTYENDSEQSRRQAIFMQNYNEIAAHNEKFRKGEVSYDMELNEFSDLSEEEFVAKFTGAVVDDETEEDFANAPVHQISDDVEMPNFVDWRRKRVVSGVKNQGSCGSCWTFATTGVLESQVAIKKRHYYTLSEQQLVDCSRKKYNNHGCNGGMYTRAFSYIKDNNGLDYEYYYGYEGVQKTCRYQSRYVSPDTKGLRGYKTTRRGSESDLQKAVATVGPIAIAIYVNSNFQRYKKGVYYDRDCSKPINHAVLVVGYGHDSTSNMDYWIVKNSWGSRWGESGYIRMARNKGNMCSIATYGAYPLI